MNIDTNEIVFLECIFEDLTSKDMCKEFEIVVTDYNATFKRRGIKKIYLKKYSLADLLVKYQQKMQYNIKRINNESWFGSTSKMYDGLDSILTPSIKNTPAIGIPFGVIVGVPALFIIPVIGGIYDFIKLPYTAYNNSARIDDAWDISNSILGHLFDQTTEELIEISSKEYTYLAELLLNL